MGSLEHIIEDITITIDIIAGIRKVEVINTIVG